ncbi:hypothetical protein [Nocardioides immobilis]|uniref:hypothetical protein n=1 Tax=Nocardioides immobilis TaxID=2049295 RepID=UPI0011C42FB1|nr:hypothetical protein [Nocardioides immobilis]
MAHETPDQWGGSFLGTEAVVDIGHLRHSLDARRPLEDDRGAVAAQELPEGNKLTETRWIRLAMTALKPCRAVGPNNQTGRAVLVGVMARLPNRICSDNGPH